VVEYLSSKREEEFKHPVLQKKKKKNCQNLLWVITMQKKRAPLPNSGTNTI
jgi:hypothetical protein